MLTLQEILDVMWEVNATAREVVSVGGGAALKIHGLEIETGDVDLMSLEPLPIVAPFIARAVSSAGTLSYRVLGVPVELWVIQGPRAGLFREVLATAEGIAEMHRVSLEGMGGALAVRLSSGRLKDLVSANWLAHQRPETVPVATDLLKRHAPKWLAFLPTLQMREAELHTGRVVRLLLKLKLDPLPASTREWYRAGKGVPCAGCGHDLSLHPTDPTQPDLQVLCNGDRVHL